jgi:hypothetical protein
MGSSDADLELLFEGDEHVAVFASRDRVASYGSCRLMGGDAGIRAFRAEYNGTAFIQDLAREQAALVRRPSHSLHRLGRVVVCGAVHPSVCSNVVSPIHFAPSSLSHSPPQTAGGVREPE